MLNLFCRKNLLYLRQNILKISVESIEDKISSYIKRKPKGELLFAEDFIAFADTKRINKALERLHDQGQLARVAMGIYTRPKEDPIVGKVLPTVEHVARAIAKRDKARIIPTGTQALYQLGLTNQMPINVVFYTDASDRKIQIGKRKITFKKGVARNLSYKGKLSMLAVQAMKSIGKDQITTEEIELIRERIKEEDPKLLQHDLRLAPAWIRVLLNSKTQDHA
jgi:hypothetical protein